MIPKIIHYCWFGNNEKNDIIKKCIKSWEEKLKGYEIIEWNERNFDINQCNYSKEAYQMKQWAFVSDYVRLKCLYDHGGIYFDTDMEVKKSIEPLLVKKLVLSYYSENQISGGFFAVEKNNAFIKKLLDVYENNYFDRVPNNNIINELIKKEKGIVLNNTKFEDEDSVIYTKEKMSENRNNDGYCVHHDQASWLTREDLTRRCSAFKTNYQLAIDVIKFLVKDLQEKNELDLECVSIYGAGELGKILVDILKLKNITVEYLIDNNCELEKYNEISIIKSNAIEKLEKTEMLIITPVHQFEQIKESINIDKKIIGLNEFLGDSK